MNVGAVYQDESVVAVDDYPLIPAGEYLACYVGHQTLMAFKQPKVYVNFRIADGPYIGTKLFRAYRVKALVGRPRKNGRFVVRRTQELYRQFVAIADSRERPDRIALSRLHTCVLRVVVRTVTQDCKQRELGPGAQYSVLDRMLAIEAGSAS